MLLLSFQVNILNLLSRKIRHWILSLPTEQWLRDCTVAHDHTVFAHVCLKSELKCSGQCILLPGYPSPPSSIFSTQSCLAAVPLLHFPGQGCADHWATLVNYTLDL